MLKQEKDAMKTYNLRVTSTQVKYCSVTAKSLKEAVAQADYQLLVNPPRLIDGTIEENKTYEIVDLPEEPMLIDQKYLEFTDKGWLEER